MTALKPGWHRVVARDGQIAGMLVATGGRLVEIVVVGRGPAPSRPTRRYLGTPAALAERAERRQTEATVRGLQALAELGAGPAAGGDRVPR